MNKNLFSAVAFDLEAIHADAAGDANSLLAAAEILESYGIQRRGCSPDTAAQMLLQKLPQLCDLLFLIWRDLTRNLDALELATRTLDDAQKAGEPKC
jgi:hypothetical protein